MTVGFITTRKRLIGIKSWEPLKIYRLQCCLSGDFQENKQSAHYENFN